MLGQEIPSVKSPGDFSHFFGMSGGRVRRDCSLTVIGVGAREDTKQLLRERFGERVKGLRA
jgi:hypothetical protein